jgi:hypothetical protein
MSKGHGRVQVAVLALLRRRTADAGLDTLVIAARVYSVRHPSEAQAVAVRRALAGLTRLGLVERLGSGGRGHGQDVSWRSIKQKERTNKQR